MKLKIYIFITSLGLALYSVPLFAYTVNVNDDYIGQANGTLHSNVNADDLTGTGFSITDMDFSDDGTTVTFTIHSVEHATHEY